MEYVCKICNEKIESNAHFYKKHGYREEEYYLEYEPRYSLSGEKILFKNREFYLNADFNTKVEMKKWFKENPDKAKDYICDFIQKRKDKKNLKFAMSQVELKSLMSPSMPWFRANLDSYNEFCTNLGLQTRFDNESDKLDFGNLKEEAIIITDTREQLPFKLKDHKISVETLKYGDYALKPNKFKVHIERKSLNDFVGTLGKGFDRFCREIDRAKKDNAYLVVLVESKISQALSFNYLPQMKYTKVSPDYIFHHVRDIMQKYSNIQFVFCDGKKSAEDTLIKIFSMKKHPKHFDLEYLYEIGVL